ncbi:Spc7 kinetochore protein-domain-containing protein [Collybia nuda]|uniref:Spc7 kinetochore protein-domain-containing protein n=1 Tax=Collybia nuda TaxID=64659 RepID=A0A9P6CAI0_9AGAR|nr:Spc7 kinetochore protein-domain-containing protein [Collybia nuda]
MAVSKDSPHRRRSIAVLNQNKPNALSRARRRAHSVVPGDLSPLAKARRSLVPRKSILKARPSISHIEDSLGQQSQSQTPSQSAQLQVFATDDANVTQSTDFTNDFQVGIRDNTSRQSLGGRRVSFASHVRVRVIEGVNKNAADPAQSPESPVSDEPSSEEPQRPVTNENIYPGAASISRRRSSTRHSLANSEGEDMDLTAVVQPGFLDEDGSALVDEELEREEDGDSDDMDVTEVIHGDLIRKRSLSLGVRQPLTQVSQADDLTSNSNDHSRSYQDNESQSQSELDSDHSEPMEFTMPLKRSMRPPAEHDEVWLALRQATHSGDTPIEPEPSSDDSGHDHVNIIQEDGMNLDDAVQRLMKARESLPFMESIPHNTDHIRYEEPRDDTFSSIDDSFADEGYSGDRTMNMSKVFGRENIGIVGDVHTSMGYQESTMDESQIYGAIVHLNQSTPRQHPPSPEIPSALKSSVFQPPPPKPSSDPVPTSAAGPNQPTLPPPVSSNSREISPSKGRILISAPSSPVKRFSAAFAPPVSRSTPKKAMSSKRPRQTSDGGASDIENISLDQPSPSKRPNPKPLSPSKKAPFQAPSGETTTLRLPSLRRPSGYFSRRKSLGAGVGAKPLEDGEATETQVKSTPKKKAGLGLGRASMGSGISDARARFEKNAGAALEEIEKEQRVHGHVQEASLQATEAPNQSLAPASAQSPLHEVSLPITHAVDISTILGPDILRGDEDITSMEIDSTEQWRGGIELNELTQDNERPISIEQFFTITGIKFMDEITAPRRSTHLSQRTTRQPRSLTDIPLAEYVTAMGVEVPQLVLYSRVSKDLQAWVEKSKADFAQAEDEASKITPELFTEFSRADEEGQAELLHQLQLIRTNTRGLAKSDWYDWKLQWLEGLRITADQMFKSLETDARILEHIRASVDEAIPALTEEYEEIMRELDKENTEVAEIEASDQEYLNELKASIAEQNIEVEALQAEVAEGRSQLRWLQEKHEEVDVQKSEAMTAIAEAHRVLHIQKNSTRVEVFRLKSELEALEDLHMFRATKVSSGTFEYVYASQFRVFIPCKNFVPVMSRVNVSGMEKACNKHKDHFPLLSKFLLDMAKQQIIHGGNLTTRQIVQRLGDYWSSCAQLRSQLTLLTVKYPIEIEILPLTQDESPTFKATVVVMFSSVKAKALISFVFTAETFSHWPMSINSLRYEVEVVYGTINREAIIEGVTNRLAQASPADNYACLLDACIEAQDIYN